MPIVSQSSSNIMLSFKLLLISTIFLSAAILMKFSVPAITDFAVYEVPSIYNGVVSWLRPPYLYLVINCIIITIVASSKLQSRKDDDLSLSPAPLKPLEHMVNQHPQPMATMSTVESINQNDEYNYNGVLLNSTSSYDVKVEKGLGIDAYENVYAIALPQKEVAPFAIDVAAGSGVVFGEDAMSNKENEFVAAKSSWNAPDSKDLTEYSLSNVKPPVSARFGHRKILKASPEGGKAVLGVSKPKRQDTLESTWKTITDGRAIPLTRHLKKSDTWERDAHAHQQEKTPQKIVNKAETFNDRTNTRSPLMSPGSGGGGGGSTSGKLRKEPSLTQDELNRRVEAFIKKFNEEMRLQRQESLNQYVQMINRGSR